MRSFQHFATFLDDIARLIASAIIAAALFVLFAGLARADDGLAARGPEVLWLVKAGCGIAVGVCLALGFALWLQRRPSRPDIDWSGDNAEAGRFPTERGE